MTAIQTQRPTMPMDARTAMAHARGAMAATGIEEAALASEVLVRHVLAMDRTELFTHPERRVTTAQQATLEALLDRCLKREPLAYVLGNRDFYGLSFAVTPAVLVPRPETEILVEQALAWSRTRAAVLPPRAGGSEREREERVHPSPLASRGSGPLIIADIGTGSGCIAVSLAAHLRDARIIATDTSSAALEVAEANTRRHGVQDRVSLLHGSLLEPLAEPVDLIVANLPYVRDKEIAGLQPEVRDYEPSEALAGGPDGTLLLRTLLEQASSHLSPGGAVMLEMDPRQRKTIVAAARAALPGVSVQVAPDLAGLDRVLGARLALHQSLSVGHMVALKSSTCS